MKSKLIRFSLGLSLLALTGGQLAAQVTNGFQIYHAIEVVYQTERGKTYMLQGAVGLTNWTDVGDAVLGNGQIEDRIFSTKESTINFAAYRLQIAPGPTNGYAPWLIDGVNLQMDDDSSSNVVQYLSVTNGQDVYVGGNDPFSYSYSRITASDGRLDRTYSPDRHDFLTYSYTGSGVGTWTRDEYEHGVLKSHNVGSFHYVGYSTNNPTGTNNPPTIDPTEPPAPPVGLSNLTYYVFTGPVPDQYQFTSDTAGLATPGTISSGRHSDSSPGGNAYTYTYTVLSSNTASLNINFGYYGIGGDRQEYDLTFTDGPSGQFSRRIYRLGSLFTTDHGVFSPNSTLPTTTVTNSPPGLTNEPPANPVGLTYTMNVGQVPPRLVFQSSTSGIEFDDSAPTDFSYTYTATGTNTFTMHVQFKPDRWDDYDLTFSSGAGGTMVRKQYRNNALNRTESGTFDIAITN